MKSIYIALPTKEDNQFKYTILDAINFATHPERVTIGAAFMTNDQFYEEHLPFLHLYRHRVKAKKFDPPPAHIMEIGKGRANALSQYAGEDLVLQVDSHTKFEPGWDVWCEQTFDEALAETGNEKTMVTSYLPAYTHDAETDNRYVLFHHRGSYPFFWRMRWDEVPELPMWQDKSSDLWPVELQDQVYKRMLPCSKVNAQFILTNHYYVENTGLPLDTVFFEEETFQTINLLAEGFSFVFPNIDIPFAHLFSNDVPKDPAHPAWRQMPIGEVPEDRLEYTRRTKESYLALINDPANKDKVDKFYAYTKCHPIYGPFNDWYMPSEYNR